MSVSIPDSMIFDILGKLPSQAFKIEYREFKSNSVPNGNAYKKNETFRINMSGAVNEFVLVDSTTLDCDMSSFYKLPDGTTEEQSRNRSDEVPAWRPFTSWIGSVRESVNSGSLVTYENTERTTFNVFQCMRAALTRCPFNYDNLTKYTGIVATNDILDCSPQLVNPDYFSMQGLESAGIVGRKFRRLGFVQQETAGPVVAKQWLGNGARPYSVPLTAISSLFQSTSVIPIGLLSTYSAQSYGLDIKIASEIEAIGLGALAPTGATEFYISNPVIRCKIIKILQPEVMEAILSLYNKSENFEVQDGMKIPLSLQLNSLQYNHHQFTLPANQSEYYVRIPSTAASLRGLAFRFVQTATLNATAGQLRVTGYPLSDDYESSRSVVVTKFSIVMGGESLMQSSLDNYTINMPTGVGNANEIYTVNTPDQFFRQQRKISGHLFSARHHSRDAKERDGIEDLIGCYPVVTDVTLNNLSSIVRPYCINLENMNHFENNNQSTGIDCRSIGGIDLKFSLGQGSGAVGSTTSSNGATTNPTVSLTMLVIAVSDYVLEVSRSGVKDISSQTL